MKGYRAPSMPSLTAEESSFIDSMRPLMERISPLHGIDLQTLGENESMQLRLLKNVSAQFHLPDNLRELIVPGDFAASLNLLVQVAHPTDAFMRQFGELVSNLELSLGRHQRGKFTRVLDWILRRNKTEQNARAKQATFTSEQARHALREIETRTLEIRALMERHANQKTFRAMQRGPDVERVRVAAESTTSEGARVRVDTSTETHLSTNAAEEDPAACLAKSLTALAAERRR